MSNSIEDVYKYINDHKDEILEKIQTFGNYNKENGYKYEIVKPGYTSTSYYINFNIIKPGIII